jgi:uncharacterized protein (DUF362 family)
MVLADPPRETVVHVHAAGATSWDFATGWYGDHVDQVVVNEMVGRGLTSLTARDSVADAWGTLMPDYEPGQRIAIKVNLNNATGCADSDNAIDALIEVVNAVVGSLVAAGVHAEDVRVYDALRSMPARFYDRRQYTQALYLDAGGCADARATFNHSDSSLRVSFSHAALQRERWLTDLLAEATYLINVPILKIHGLPPVTLGFKNHFGSLSDLGGGGNDNPHYYIDPRDTRYSADYSPLVDINANPNIAGKTVLTVGDGLFGAPAVWQAPVRWAKTYGNQAPNSLLFSRDPVAIDCVMCDLLRAEFGLFDEDAAYDYMRLAETRGLGVFERGEPWASGYQKIIYHRVQLT